MAASEHFEYVFASDANYSEGGIPGLTFPANAHRIQTPTSRRGKLYWQGGLMKVASDPEVDAIVAMSIPYCLSYWPMAAYARLRGKRVYFWTHGWTHAERGVNAFMRRLFYMLPHSLMLYGSHAKRYGESIGYPAARMDVIFNSLDYDVQKGVRESISAEEVQATRSKISKSAGDTRILCFIGRLTPNCRLELLIEAAALLQRERSVSLLIIGDGTERQRLEQLARDAGIDASFTGQKYEEREIAKYLMASDVLVSPGKVGLTAMHAMTYGLPVITSGNWSNQMPEYEAVVPGSTGMLLPELTAPSVASTLREWFALGVSRADVAKACIAEIEARWTPKGQLEIIEGILARDLGLSAAPSTEGCRAPS